MTGKARPLRIGLYGPYGCGNLGDAAIQESVLQNVRRRLPEAEFLGISLNPKNTERIHGIPAFPIRWSRPSRAGVEDGTEVPVGLEPESPSIGDGQLKARIRRVRWLFAVLKQVRLWAIGLRDTGPRLNYGLRRWAVLRDLDYLVISGGGQFSDDWGDAWHHPFALASWVGLARLAGTRVHVLSVGVGPIVRPSSRRFFHLVLRLAHGRSYRDLASRDYLSDLALTRDDPVYPDLAFALPAAPHLTAPRQQPVKATVGVAAMSFFKGPGSDWIDASSDRYSRHESVLTDFICSLLADGHNVHLFYTQIQSDPRACGGIIRSLAQRSWEPDGRRLTAEPTQDLDHLLTQIAATDIVVSARLHGLILSLHLGRPVIALSYQPKVNALMRDFGLDKYCLDIDSLTSEGIEACFRSLLSNQVVVENRIRETASSHKARLAAQFDDVFAPATGE